MRAAKTGPFCLGAALVVLAVTDLSAHRRDEYLQAARLAVEPGRVELFVDLTPGIEVADSIIGVIDRDGDGRFSAGEQQAYAASVLNALDLRADDRALDLATATATFPGLDALRGGVGTIQIRTAARLPHPLAGHHELVFRNRHRPDVSVYLANALVPDGDTVTITAQRRDAAQRDLSIAYVVSDERAGSTPAWLMGVLSAMLLVALRARR